MQQNNSVCADYFTFSYTVIIVKYRHALSHHDQCKYMSALLYCLISIINFLENIVKITFSFFYQCG